MDTEKIFKLLDAGFTADEIRKIMQLAAAPEKPAAPAKPEKAAPEKAEPEKPEQPAAPAPEKKEPATADVIAQAVAEAIKPFNELYDKMAKLTGMPSMDNVEPLGIDDIVSKFFKED